MEEWSIVWIIAGFFAAIALRNFFLQYFRQQAIHTAYRRELNDILTKDEHKVKGRFE